MNEYEISQPILGALVARAGLPLTPEHIEQLSLGWQHTQPLLRRLRRNDRDTSLEPAGVCTQPEGVETP